MWQTLLLSLLGLASSAAFHPAVAPQRRQSFTVHASTLVEPTLPPRRPGGAVPKVIFVDGNNLMMQRKVTKGRENLAEKLSAVKEGAFQIVLVFDGRKGEAASVVGEHPQVVVTSGGDETTGEGRMSADEYIVEQLATVDRRTHAEVVTADKWLRKQAQQQDAKTINPVKWWRRYLPRLQGLKSDYTNPDTSLPYGVKP